MLPESAIPREVATVLRTTEERLAQLRYRGDGPPFFRVGRRVLYRWVDVEQYIADSLRTRTDS
jgi:hypothetical protein